MKPLSLAWLLIVATPLYANPNGWRWYNEPKAPIVQPKPPPPKQPHATVTQTPSKPMTATEQMNWF
ncbi:type-F conjugative transfer system pilin assembly protein TraF, partial [Photobacterium damselae]